MCTSRTPTWCGLAGRGASDLDVQNYASPKVDHSNAARKKRDRKRRRPEFKGNVVGGLRTRPDAGEGRDTARPAATVPSVGGRVRRRGFLVTGRGDVGWVQEGSERKPSVSKTRVFHE